MEIARLWSSWLRGIRLPECFLNAATSPLSCPQFQESWKPPFTSKRGSRIAKFSLKSWEIQMLWFGVLCHSMTVPRGRVRCVFPRIWTPCHPRGHSSQCIPKYFWGGKTQLPLPLGLNWAPQKSPSPLFQAKFAWLPCPLLDPTNSWAKISALWPCVSARVYV